MRLMKGVDMPGSEIEKKRAEILKGISELTEDRFRGPAERAGLEWDKNFNSALAQNIMENLDSRGVVIKVDSKLHIMHRDGLQIARLVKNAGYVAVEPLVVKD